MGLHSTAQTTIKLRSAYPDYALLEGHFVFVADELLRPVKHIKTVRLLDVGCGMGFMLSRFRELGWDTYGIDVSSYAVDVIATSMGNDTRGSTGYINTTNYGIAERVTHLG